MFRIRNHPGLGMLAACKARGTAVDYLSLEGRRVKASEIFSNLRRVDAEVCRSGGKVPEAGCRSVTGLDVGGCTGGCGACR